MKTWFLTFRVVPSKDNEDHYFIGGALAHFWIVDYSSKNALSRAQDYLADHKWTVINLEQPPVERVAEHFSQKDVGIKQFFEAQKTGFSSAFFAWEKEGSGHA